MFDIGPGEIIVLLLVALFVFGPDRLPGYARQAGRFLREARAMVASARRDLTEQVGVDLSDLGLDEGMKPVGGRDMRAYVRRTVLDGLDDDDEPAPRARSANPTEAATPDPPTVKRPAPDFDADAI